MIKIENIPYAIIPSNTNSAQSAVIASNKADIKKDFDNNLDIEHLKTSLDSVLNRKDLGYLDLVNRNALWSSSEELGQKIKSAYNQSVVIGFGGSSMGARALAEISHSKNVIFFDNVDFIENIHLLENISDLSKTAWIFVSKSGNTIEVLTLIDFLNQYLKEKNISPNKDLSFSLLENSFFITELKQSPLFALAKKHDRPCLEIPLDVGGRFSVLTPAGLLVASLCGFDLSKIKDGAKAALKDKTTVLYLTQQYLSSFENGKNISLFWFYNSSVRWLGGWLQQLWAESLGKSLNRQNQPAHFFSTPMIAIGSSDQHSILQQVMDGEKNKFVTFFRFENIENGGLSLKETTFNETASLKNKNSGELIKAQALGTAEALTENQVPQMTVLLKDTREQSLGYFFMLYQLIVSLLAEYHDVNAFDQPGVQLGKLKTLEKLKES